MTDIEFKIEGGGELERSLERAARKYPASAELVLKREIGTVVEDLKRLVDEEAKGHNYYRDKDEEEKNGLAMSFRQGKVIRSGSKMTIAATSKAPHYHLYEEGHDMVTHTGKKVGKVRGRKTVARYMAKRAENAEEIGEAVLNAILEDAGLT